MNCYVYADGIFYKDKLTGPVVDLGPHKELLSTGSVTLHLTASGRSCFYLNGKRHREDGPAISCLNNPHLNQWWYNGYQISVNNIKDFNRIVKLKAFW